jgi:hypothetical protein
MLGLSVPPQLMADADEVIEWWTGSDRWLRRFHGKHIRYPGVFHRRPTKLER